MRFRATPHVWQRLDRNLEYRLTAIHQERECSADDSPSILAFESRETRREVSVDGGILRFDRAAILRPYLAGSPRVRRNRYVP